MFYNPNPGVGVQAGTSEPQGHTQLHNNSRVQARMCETMPKKRKEREVGRKKEFIYGSFPWEGVTNRPRRGAGTKAPSDAPGEGAARRRTAVLAFGTGVNASSGGRLLL